MELNFLDPNLWGALLGFILTLSVFSYLLGDNFLFRLAIHIFIGVASGYAAVMAFYNIIWPQLLLPFLGVGSVSLVGVLIPLALGLLLLFKALPRFSSLGSPSVAFLLAVGVATALGGAILGTVLPQAQASINTLDPAGGQPILAGSLVLLGTVASLAYFHFGAKPGLDGELTRGPLVETLARIGQVFIAITFGALFAGVLAASLAALAERVGFLVSPLLSFLLPK